MKAVRVEWNRGDTFDTMHKKLLALVGQEIVNKREKTKPFKVFKVSDVREALTESIGAGFFMFLAGDEKYTTSKGEYNFKGAQYTPEWEFVVEFGFEHLSGQRISWPYNFRIIRRNSYEEDKSQIVTDPNHPFVHYADYLWKK